MAAESSFLFKSNFADLPDFVEFMHNVYRSHLVSRRRIPMTACMSNKLMQVTLSKEILSIPTSTVQFRDSSKHSMPTVTTR